jgi:hypothetical protein
MSNPPPADRCRRMVSLRSVYFYKMERFPPASHPRGGGLSPPARQTLWQSAWSVVNAAFDKLRRGEVRMRPPAHRGLRLRPGGNAKEKCGAGALSLLYKIDRIHSFDIRHSTFCGSSVRCFPVLRFAFPWFFGSLFPGSSVRCPPGSAVHRSIHPPC